MSTITVGKICYCNDRMVEIKSKVHNVENWTVDRYQNECALNIKVAGHKRPVRYQLTHLNYAG